MFEGSDFPKSLDEDVFDAWLESGRQHKLSFNYLMIIWNELEMEYQPVYIEERDMIKEYARDKGLGTEVLVAAYDLYSESRIV